MNDIELLKANLNAEKVFYNLRWHELIPEGSSENSEQTNCKDLSFTSANLNKKHFVSNSNKTKSAPSKKSSSNSSPKRAIIRASSTNMKSNSSDKITNVNNDNSRFSKKSWFALTMLDVINKFFNSKNCCYKGKNGLTYIEEIEEENAAFTTDFKPPVDILYDKEKLLLLFLVSGKIKHLKVAFDKSSSNLTVSGTKLLHDCFNENNFISHEIKSGYFKRKFLLKKPVLEEEIIYNQENGVIKIVVPFRMED